MAEQVYELPDTIKDDTLLIKAEDETDPKYGCAPQDRAIREYINWGSINLDKPSGPTSHEVVSWVKKILELDKAGHSGTLDPRVTGILPVMLGRATRALGSLFHLPKEYVCLMKLHATMPEETLQNIANEFTGKIYQKPPMKSAVKQQIRQREIYYIQLLETDDRSVLMKIGCEAGTYIRKLVHDIGRALGTGAHMYQLRRTQVGPFTEDKTLVTLHDIKDAYVFWQEDGDEEQLRKVIMPMEKGLRHLSKVVIKDSAVDAICHGADLAMPGVLKLSPGIKPGDVVAMFSLKGEAVATGSAQMSSEQMSTCDDGVAIKTKRVFMEPGTYPKMWSASG